MWILPGAGSWLIMFFSKVLNIQGTMRQSKIHRIVELEGIFEKEVTDVAD